MIDEGHACYPMKYMRNKPVKDLKDEQYLKIVQVSNLYVWMWLSHFLLCVRSTRSHGWQFIHFCDIVLKPPRFQKPCGAEARKKASVAYWLRHLPGVERPMVQISGALYW